ncbi:MAG: hypothetical protein V7724_05100 [Sediminicola sp.]|tara:strand:+ start:13586 stop:14050 length:465 start_codon:yes stop_codon:yes gene_type:complete
MKKIVLLAFAIGTLFSCKNDDDNRATEGNYLIFGHFYGFCIGETCVQTFKVTDSKLYKDTAGDYTGQDFEFSELDNALFEEVKDVVDFLPDQLLKDNETVFGCPDCADGGGLFIQYLDNGNLKTWRIDQMKENVPSYLHNFMDKVNEKIALINE